MARLWVGGKISVPEGNLYSEEWQNFYGTQIELLEGPRIQRRASERLGMAYSLTNRNLIKVTVNQPRKTSIFVLEAQGVNPVQLEAYLNALMDEYLSYRRECRSSSSEDTLTSLAEQLARQEKELKTAQGQLVEFLKKNNEVALKEEGISAASYLTKLNIQMADLKLDQTILEQMTTDALLDQTKGMSRAALKNELVGLAEATAEGATSSIGWRDARQTVDLLRIQRDSLSKDLKAQHPRIIKINEDIERLEKLIAVYEEESKDKLNRSRVALKTRISSVEQAAQKWESLVLDANGRMSEFERLRGDVQRAQTLYDRVAHLLQNVDVTKSVSQENVAILDPAFVKPAPLRAAVKLPLVMIIGGIVGVGLVGFMAHRDDRCTGIMELRRYGIPVVGQIPKAPIDVGNQNMEWIGPQDKRLEWTESFRTLRAGLLASNHDGNNAKVLLITSPLSGDGTTTIAGNLARALAMGGSRVVLVDCDLKRGRLDTLFAMEGAAGLADKLDGETSREIVHGTDLPKLFLLPKGHCNGNASDLLVRPALASLLQQHRNSYDHIILDGPPLLGEADAITLTRLADAVVIVVREGGTRSPAIENALDILEQNNAVVAGFVLNHSKTASAGIMTKIK